MAEFVIEIVKDFFDQKNVNDLEWLCSWFLFS